MPYIPTPVALAGRQSLGASLRHWREVRGLTQERLALAAGMDRSFLADLENGHHSCAVDRIFDLASALDVDAATLLSDTSH